jgi:hypothetical protein
MNKEEYEEKREIYVEYVKKKRRDRLRSRVEEIKGHDTVKEYGKHFK